MGKPVKLRVPRAEIVGGGDVEPGQPQRAAEEIEARDEPADLVRDVVEHDLEDEQRGRDAEADDVGQRIELAAEGAFLAAEAGEPAVEQIEEAGRRGCTEMLTT